MLSNRQLFFNHLAQTSPSPLALEIDCAKGVHLIDQQGKAYIDLISGISVSNIGHSNPMVSEAVKKQLDKHLHLMVYGEFIQNVQTQLVQLLTSVLPRDLDNVYLVNSGSEAVDGAIKLVKRYTGRSKIIACRNAYHGGTIGALSLLGDEQFKEAFRPLMPGVEHIQYGSFEDLEAITDEVAAIFIEPYQAEAGVIISSKEYMLALRNKCNATGTLLVFDEIQTGMGRTGTLFAFEQLEVVPDVLLLAKAFGAGLPLGAFVSSKKIMECLTNNPILGHITTFGGHPLSCAAAHAGLQFLLKEKIIEEVESKGTYFEQQLQQQTPEIVVRRVGLLMAIQFSTAEENQAIINYCLEHGVVTDWFLFADDALRIAPPLIITYSEIDQAVAVIVEAINKCGN